jgi:hypothetical protein
VAIFAIALLDLMFRKFSKPVIGQDFTTLSPIVH